VGGLGQCDGFFDAEAMGQLFGFVVPEGVCGCYGASATGVHVEVAADVA